MKAHALILFLVTTAIPAFSQNSSTDGRAQILANLSRVESLYLPRLSGKELQDAVRLLNETRSLVGGLPANRPDSALGSANLLSDEGLRGLADNVRKEYSDRRRTELILSSLGKKGKITVSQVRTLFQSYSSNSDSEREDLLVRLRDNLVDPVNIALVLDFRSDWVRNQVLDAYKDQ